MKERKFPSFTEDERKVRSAILEKIIRTAALEVDKNGSIAVLADKCHISYHGIRSAINKGYFTPPMAAVIELSIGRDIIKKEDLCPHIYNQ